MPGKKNETNTDKNSKGEKQAEQANTSRSSVRFSVEQTANQPAVAIYREHDEHFATVRKKLLKRQSLIVEENNKAAAVTSDLTSTESNKQSQVVSKIDASAVSPEQETEKQKSILRPTLLRNKSYRHKNVNINEMIAELELKDDELDKRFSKLNKSKKKRKSLSSIRPKQSELYKDNKELIDKLIIACGDNTVGMAANKMLNKYDMELSSKFRFKIEIRNEASVVPESEHGKVKNLLPKEKLFVVIYEDKFELSSINDKQGVEINVPGKITHEYEVVVGLDGTISLELRNFTYDEAGETGLLKELISSSKLKQLSIFNGVPNLLGLTREALLNLFKIELDNSVNLSDAEHSDANKNLHALKMELRKFKSSIENKIFAMLESKANMSEEELMFLKLSIPAFGSLETNEKPANTEEWVKSKVPVVFATGGDTTGKLQQTLLPDNAERHKPIVKQDLYICNGLDFLCSVSEAPYNPDKDKNIPFKDKSIHDKREHIKAKLPPGVYSLMRQYYAVTTLYNYLNASLNLDAGTKTMYPHKVFAIFLELLTTKQVIQNRGIFDEKAGEQSIDDPRLNLILNDKSKNHNSLVKIIIAIIDFFKKLFGVKTKAGSDAITFIRVLDSTSAVLKTALDNNNESITKQTIFTKNLPKPDAMTASKSSTKKPGPKQ